MSTINEEYEALALDLENSYSYDDHMPEEAQEIGFFKVFI